MNVYVQITREAYGMVKTIELIPNGTHINVTKENKLVFCHKLSCYCRLIRLTLLFWLWASESQLECNSVVQFVI